VIREAARAVLEIQDGEETTPIELSRTDLAIGGYGYMRRTGHVSVHMKVEGGTPAEEYSKFSSSPPPGSQASAAGEADPKLARALAEKEHLKTQLIAAAMQSKQLRQQVADLTGQIGELRRQLAQEHAKVSPISKQ